MIEKLLNLPLVASQHGHQVDHLMVLLHLLMGGLGVGWTVFFIYVLWRFRASRKHKASYRGADKKVSTWLEFVVAGLEILLLVGFAIPLWGSVVEDFPPEKESTVVRVVAEQFMWHFVYPGPDGKFGRQDMSLVGADNPYGFDPSDPSTKDNFEVLNELHVPRDKPVILNVSSKDVIHCFKVVAMRVTQDCIPGLNIPVHFVPIRDGKYQVVCAQLCGNGHATMSQGIVVVQPPDEYQKWMGAKVSGAGPATTFE